MKISTLCILSLLFASALFAKAPSYAVRNLTKEMHISGPTLQVDDLTGKLVVVEVWGISCPPCRASLKGMGDLARKYKKDKRVLIIGAHAQAPNKEAVAALLKQNKCEYPVYQFFTTDLDPNFPGIPNVYIISPDGECVWKGHPKHLEATLDKLVKALPKATGSVGSLVEGIELKTFKSMQNQLFVGKNVERALQQIKARAAKNPKFQEEAEAIIAACETWAEHTETTLRENLETLPSLSVIAYQQLNKTFPTRARAFREEMMPLMKSKPITLAVRSRQALLKAKQQPLESENDRKRIQNSVKMQKRNIDVLIQNMGDKATDDLLDLQTQWNTFLDELTPSSN